MATLSFAPDAFTTFTICLEIGSLAVLLAVFPLADVLATVRPFKSSLSMLLIIQVFTLVFPAVRPSEQTSALHLIAEPLACVDASITPSVLSIALDIIVDEVTLELRSICPNEDTMSMLFAFLVDAGVFGAVGPRFCAFAVLLVFKPLAYVRSSVIVSEGAVSIRHVVLPITCVDI